MDENTNGNIKFTANLWKCYTKESTYTCCCLTYQLLRGDEKCPKFCLRTYKKEYLYIVIPILLTGPLVIDRALIGQNCKYFGVKNVSVIGSLIYEVNREMVSAGS